MKKLILLNIFLLLSFSFFTATIFAHDGHAVPKPKNLDDFLASFKPLGWNIGKTQIISKKVGDNFMFSSVQAVTLLSVSVTMAF